MTAAPEVLPTARSEAELIEALRRRRHALGLSQLDLDERVGWATGYTGKAEQPNGLTRDWKKWGRRVMLQTFTEWAQGLGCVVALIRSTFSTAGRDNCASPSWKTPRHARNARPESPDTTFTT